MWIKETKDSKEKVVAFQFAVLVTTKSGRLILQKKTEESSG